MRRIALAGLFLSLTGCVKDYEVQFIGEPCLNPYKIFDFKLCSDFHVKVGNTIYSVPKGFVSDLATIPRFMWAFYSPNDSRTIRAAILHDYMYRFNTGLPRKQVDDIFYHALMAGGASHATASKYYLGVRAFGWKFYRK